MFALTAASVTVSDLSSSLSLGMHWGSCDCIITAIHMCAPTLQTYLQVRNGAAYSEQVSVLRRRLANQQPAIWVLQRQRIAYLEALLHRAAAQSASQQRAQPALARAVDDATQRACNLERCSNFLLAFAMSIPRMSQQNILFRWYSQQS